MGRFGVRVWSLLLIGLVACGDADLPGFYWNLSVNTNDDQCNSPAVQYNEAFEYRLVIDENDTTQVDVAIGPDTFASGEINGCLVTYDSIVWTEVRDQGDIQWTLRGEATAQRGDGSCGIASDWLGTETFTVLSSEDPTVSPGCEYVLNVTGTYVGEVE